MPGADRKLRDRYCIERILHYCDQIDASLTEIHHDQARFMLSHCRVDLPQQMVFRYQHVRAQ